VVFDKYAAFKEPLQKEVRDEEIAKSEINTDDLVAVKLSKKTNN
jgi:hypothetical protein